MNTNEQYLKVAINAAKDSGKIFKQYFGKTKTVSQKNGSPKDLVTKADVSIETKIRKAIVKNFPTHKVIGEEMGTAKNIGVEDFVWIIDPIDGTSNFIQGLPLCCISIALWDKNGPLVGVIYNPSTEELYSAMRNKGAYLNGKKITVSTTNKISSFFVGFGWGHDQSNKSAKLVPKLTKIFRKVRCLGVTAFDLCMVAKGAYDGHIQTKSSIWDVAAAMLIVQEAGGEVTDERGKPLTLQSLSAIASNGKIHNQLLNKLKNRS